MQLDPPALDLIFRNARSQNGWKDTRVTEATLRELYELAKMGPTSMNCSPMRVVFALSAAAKEQLAAAVSPGNVQKVLTAPAVAIIGCDLDFPATLPRLFPHLPTAGQLFEGKPKLVSDTALRNSSLQGAYLMLAARALGLDVGPMSGFDADKVEAAFFPDGKVKANFLCGLGIGDPAKVFPRSPRWSFDEACHLV